MNVPERVFIVPYRDRVQHKHFFGTYITHILEDYDPSTYEIYYAHQKDTRMFNRGAMKNIGFKALKAKYPEHYRDITFVFNDVDVLPYAKGVFTYDAAHGTVYHNYGYRNSLGGSFAIKGSDFEKVNGFPNIWAWGYEDAILQNRVVEHGINIDRSAFRPVGHKDVLQLFDGVHRTLMKQRYKKIQTDFAKDGVSSITGLEYDISGDMIDVKSFSATHRPTSDLVTRHVRDMGVNKTLRKGEGEMQSSQSRTSPPQSRTSPAQPRSKVAFLM